MIFFLEGDFLEQCGTSHRDTLGAEVHKRFEEWDGVARGTITAYDTDYPKAWTVTYEADGVSEEFDAQDVRKYAIERLDGESAPYFEAHIDLDETSHSRRHHLQVSVVEGAAIRLVLLWWGSVIYVYVYILIYMRLTEVTCNLTY
eukprot:COSAG05_NODE_192_length_14608_cov_6.266386_9_plen_145_part_00